MSGWPPGIGGSLFPARYLVDGLPVDSPSRQPDLDRLRRRLEKWWDFVIRRCGPATGIRAIFDLVAMPLFGALDFRASRVSFDRHLARVRLDIDDGAYIGLIVAAWASHPSSLWRDAAALARSLSARWCFVLTPPFLSLVDVRGHVTRRSLDFRFPEAFDQRSVGVFATLAHRSAFPQRLDHLIAAAAGFQDRVRVDLQNGVLHSLDTLMSVLPKSINRPDSARFDEALTLIYRVLFLLFVESRDLVPRHHPMYRPSYTIASLCRQALVDRDATGLWESLAAITRLSRRGCRADDLIVRPFNGRLFARAAAPSLEAASRPRRAALSNDARDQAMRHTLVALATRPGRAGREAISYADLGVEQLGAVYERVLDLDPAAVATPPARGSAGHGVRRKQTGTFYTPQALAEFVVRRTLAPLTAGATADAILSLRVVDPAMGSGAFLVAACRYLASAYERALIDEGRASATDVDEAERANIRRLIAERCLAGVDVNPVAVQLARLSLWLTSLAAGKPLGFLDHRLRAGNSLIGISPDDLRVIPGRRPIRHVTLPFEDSGGVEQTLRQLSRSLTSMSVRRDDTLADVHAKEAAWRTIAGERSALTSASRLRLACSLWCARWFWQSGHAPSDREIRAAIDALVKGDSTLRSDQLARWLTATRAIEDAHGIFHWPLEFADVFYDETGHPHARPGFDAVIGNPPWEMLRRDHESRSESLPQPSLVRFIRESGLYPSCDRGHVNLYQPFLERALTLARRGGRVGLIVPWGLATDDGATELRARLFDRSSTDTIVGLDNGKALFPIHRGLRFLAVFASPGGPPRDIQARFGVRTAAELDTLADAAETTASTDSYPIRLTPRRLEQLTGPARRIPDLRRPRDLALLEQLVCAHPRLDGDSGWRARFSRELNATDDRDAFGSRGMPVIEGKHVQPFAVDIRAATRRIERATAERLLPARPFDAPRLAYRDVSGVGNRLSLIAAIVPAGVVTTHTLFCLRNVVSRQQLLFLCGVFNSYVLNAVARLLMGGHLTTSLVESLAVPAWTGRVDQRRIARLAHRLSKQPASARVAAALQSAVARMYGLDAAGFAHVLDGFPLVPPDDRALALKVFQL